MTRMTRTTAGDDLPHRLATSTRLTWINAGIGHMTRTTVERAPFLLTPVSRMTAVDILLDFPPLDSDSCYSDVC